ncbi:MAG: TIGR03986 family CRISPR-associated RAMP protein, partial [Chloroflexi bacterium]
MLPQQANPTHPNDRASAPYNFVPLPESPVEIAASTLPDQDRYDTDRFTGRIVCTLTTRTPTFIRAALEVEEYARRLAQEQWAQDHPGAAKTCPPEDWIKNKADFFYTLAQTTPRLPGSSLRGMVRSLVQIVAAARFEAVTSRRLVYRAIADTTSHRLRYQEQIMDAHGDKHYTPRVRAGYLSKVGDRWLLQPAQEIGGTTFARISHAKLNPLRSKLTTLPGCKRAWPIYIVPGPWKFQAVRGGLVHIRYAKVLAASATATGAAGEIAGTLVESGPMVNTKHPESSKKSEAVVYPPDWDPAKTIEVDDAVIAQYREQCTPWQHEQLGPNGVLSAGETKNATPQRNKLDYWYPVFYVQEGDRLFFGHTMMMRLPYPHTVQDYLPSALQERPGPMVDIAQAIFGFSREAGEGKARSYAGRVFFGDGVLEPNQTDIWIEQAAGQTPWLYPQILAGPKATAFQQYLVQRTPDPLTREKRKRDEPEKYLSDYGSPTPDETAAAAAVGKTAGRWTQEPTTLRGDKLYWHKPRPVGRAYIEAAPKEVKDHPTQYTRMRPLRAGVTFRFTLHFENLADWELGALLWALLLPVQDGKTYCHKLGMGKPLGLGSVQIALQELTLQDRRARYTTLFVQDKDEDKAQGGQRRLKLDAQGCPVWEEGNGRVNKGQDDFIRAFEAKMGVPAGQQLADRPRMQALLKLLAFPGPNDVKMGYVPVGKDRSRPVLPAPLATLKAQVRELNAGFQPVIVPLSAAERGQGRQPDDPRVNPIDAE